MDTAWQQLGKDFNRYIQKYRRFHNSKVQYIRSIEAHADSYPHIHIILQFHTPLSVNNARYFDNVLYGKWKQLWTLGLSDYQPPRSERLPILYLIKYISKNNHTIKTLWKKILPIVNVTATQDSTPNPAVDAKINIPSTEKENKLSDIKFITTDLLCQKHKIKQLTWSRDFIFPRLPMARRPESGQQTLFTQRDK